MSNQNKTLDAIKKLQGYVKCESADKKCELCSHSKYHEKFGKCEQICTRVDGYPKCR